MPGTECRFRNDGACYQECTENIYLGEHQVPPPSDSFENLVALQKVSYEMRHSIQQLVFCSGDFLVIAKAKAKDWLDVPKDLE